MKHGGAPAGIRTRVSRDQLAHQDDVAIDSLEC